MEFDEETRDRLKRMIEDGRKIEAVKEVREITGVGLKEAVDLLEPLEREIFPERFDEVYPGHFERKAIEMGMDADVLGIGPYSLEIAEHLDYGEESYKETIPGMTVITTVFFASTSSDSRVLAECFGIDPWNFNEHQLNKLTPDFERLRQIFDEEMVQNFIALKQAGFTFFYRPNG